MKKIYILLFAIFATIIVYAFSTGVTGTTELNGNGCTCHNLSSDPDVSVIISGPTILAPGETATYTLTMSGGPAVTGGLNVAAFNGILSPFDGETQIIDDELTHTTEKAFTAGTVSWLFNYTAPANTGTDTIYSTGNSTNDDGIPSELDKWNWSNKFIINIQPIPVEFVLFSVSIVDNEIKLNWETATETNNIGFEIERCEISKVRDQINWSKIGFVEGNGTTTEKSVYSFRDKPGKNGNFTYRLSQVDYDGTISYSKKVNVEYNILPSDFVLKQNYPNPFNPSTKIEYFVPEQGYINLTVYDVLGNKIAELVSREHTPGAYSVTFDAGDFTSGIYIYKLESTNFTQTRKMILTK